MSNLFSSGGAGNVGFSGEVQQSLKFNDDESQYLSWTPASAGNRKTWTWSAWVKRGNVDVTTSVFGSGPDSDNQCFMIFANTGVISFRNEVSNSIYIVQSTALFRDPSAWYHIVAVYDSSNATSANRMRLYVNGERITDFSNEVQPSLNLDSFMNSSSYEMFIGKQRSDGTSYFEGYMSDINFIDGQALDASSFGETVDGYWKAKDYAGSYGTNGFHLTFQDDVVSEGFNTVTYTGNGGTQSISGLGFEPDFVWIKLRNQAGDYHNLFDSVRGATKRLFSNDTNAENTDVNTLTSFDADGFSVGSNGNVNTNGINVVAWAWDAGSGSAASNTDGTITSTVKANPDYGFSVVSYTGNSTTNTNFTVGHGLSQTPDMVIIKNRDWASGVKAWEVWHKDIGNNLLALDSNSAVSSGDYTYIMGAAPTSTTFSVRQDTAVTTANRYRANGPYNYIAYCFNSVAGYSSIGSYSGTGASGNSVTGLGFKPAWLMVKAASGATGNWIIWDNTRDTNDADVDNPLFANLSDAEFTAGGTYDIQFDSDGFTINNSSPNHNGSGGTYIYMAFADTREAAFWKDVSGQGNHWTPNNLDYRDSLPDSPANNFAVMNALDKTSITLSEGNLRPTPTGDFKGVRGSFAIPLTGKWFFEARVITGGGGNITDMHIGIATDQNVLEGTSPYPQEATYGVIYKLGGTIGRLGSNVQTGLPSFAAGDVLGVAINSTDNEVQFYKNGSTVGTAVGLPSTTRESFAFFVGATSRSSIFNFGQDSTFAGAKPMGAYTDDNSIGNFQYAPPTGYLALCTANLPIPTIIDGSEYFNTVLYTGTGVARSITGVGFQPDWVWVKERSSTSGHILFDSVRGVLKFLQAQDTSSEITDAEQLSSFDSDGWSVGASTGINQSGVTNVAWNWKAGGTAVSNTSGSITSQVSANTTAGFSIVSYTGTGTLATVGHSLGVKPSMMIIKNRDDSDAGSAHWLVYHEALGATHRVKLDSTEASGATAVHFNNTEPTSSVFTVNTSNAGNGSGDAMIAYCFANTDGYLKAGSYTGNGNNDGPFVYTGFRPAWVMWKNASSSEHWIVLDAERDPHNYVENKLYPSGTFVDQTSANTKVDYLSNGFKIRGTENEFNQSGNLIIYLAFAENPFKYANAR